MPRSKQSARTKTSRQRRERRESFPRTVPKTAKPTIGRSTTRETPLHLRARGLHPNEALRDYVRTRVGFKLGKYASSLTRIIVRFDLAAGLPGTAGYACRCRVIIPGAREVVVASTGSTPRAAFDSAADAAERAVRRLLERRRRTGQRSQPGR